MPKLAANISTLFLELPLEDRLAAALNAGFRGVEMRFLDSGPSPEFLSELKSTGLEMVMFNASPGDLSQGELGLAAIPGQLERFKTAMLVDFANAEKLGARKIHVMAGKSDQNLSVQQQFDAAVTAYGWAAEQAAERGITLLIEPLAPAAISGYFVDSLERAVDLVTAVGSSNFKILFDYFHMQLAGGDITARFKAASPLIGHVQFASAPSRNEPDSGELCVEFILDELDRSGYSGWVGCEYTPRTTTLDGLHWAKNWLHGKPVSIATPATTSAVSAAEPHGVLLGRIWDPAVAGPCVVTVRDGVVFDITSAKAPLVRDICEMDDPAGYVRAAKGREIIAYGALLSADPGNPDQPHLLAPPDLQAIKACGVTFAKSMVERVIEEQAAGDPAKAEEIRKRVQTVVGDSLRDLRAGSPEAMQVKAALIGEGLWSQYLEVGIGPDAEVFSKAQVLSSVGHGAKVGLHPSSSWNNPEPEVVLAVSSTGRIVGACLGNDVNLRDIEGRSALLLSKAKDNNASCAIGPFIRLLDQDFTLDDLRKAELSLHIEGPEGYVLEGHSSMTGISRDPEDLVSQVIGRHHQYPDGIMLFLGTAFAPTKDRDVPGEGFTHKCGDVVRIASDGLGELQNTVDLSTNCPEWTFGTRELMKNLARRGLI